ncbi:hypothetical protein GOODEAATRI_008124 [Goodea atripinnis]|uniref:G-protein coupled receptors family 1 profile domain-containing protein n=1 Tax=Goodea atripinnis TaxID=208336 RepID=A0ABV0NLV3_9TELE
MVQVEENYTKVSKFFIVGFPGLQLEYFHMVAWFFFILYVTTVMANLVLVVMFALEHSLQKSMYIIMVSLALSDIGEYCIFYVKKYPMMMTVPTMTALTVLSWLVAHIFPGVSSINFTKISFCGPSQIIQAFCDTTSLAALACEDKSHLTGASYATAMFILLVPLGFVIFSYFCIIISVYKMTNWQGRIKTFSTCTTQGCIIVIYYIPRFFVYSIPHIPNMKMTPDGRIATIFFYSFFPPLINPFVYFLRTKEMREILSRWIQRL